MIYSIKHIINIIKYKYSLIGYGKLMIITILSIISSIIGVRIVLLLSSLEIGNIITYHDIPFIHIVFTSIVGILLFYIGKLFIIFNILFVMTGTIFYLTERSKYVTN